MSLGKTGQLCQERKSFSTEFLRVRGDSVDINLSLPLMIAPIRRGLPHPSALLDLFGQSFSIMYLATAFVALIGLWQHWKKAKLVKPSDLNPVTRTQAPILNHL